MKKYFKKFVYSTLIISAIFLCLTGCGKKQDSDDSSEGEKNSTINLETDTGKIVYKDYEYVSKGFLQGSDADVTKVICFNFDYTNKEDSPKQVQEDFYIQAFQNGTELTFDYSYHDEYAPEGYKAFYNEVTKDGTLTIGSVFTLSDYSPVTIVVTSNNDQEAAQQQIVEIEECVDNSFDLNRLYGVWQDNNKGEKLKISEDEMVMTHSDGGSSTRSMDDAWTDETTFYSDDDDWGDFNIIQNEGEPLKLQNDNYTFVQVRATGEVAEGEEPVLAEETYEGYEECSAIPTMSEALDIDSGSRMKRTINGTVTEIKYTYTATSDQMKEYADFLKDYGFDVSESSGTYTISGNGTELASMSNDGDGVNVNIVPGNIDFKLEK